MHDKLDKPKNTTLVVVPPEGGIFLPLMPLPKFIKGKLDSLSEIYDDSIYAQSLLKEAIDTPPKLERIGALTSYFVAESLRNGGEVPKEVRTEVARVEDLMFRAASFTDICGVLQRHGERMALWIAGSPVMNEVLSSSGYGIYKEGSKKYLTVQNELGRCAVFNYYRRLPEDSKMQFARPADHFYLLHLLDELVIDGVLRAPVSLTKTAQPKKIDPRVAPEVEPKPKTITRTEDEALHKMIAILKESLYGLPLFEAWNQQNQLFLATFKDLLNPGISTISQYGVASDGELLDLRDIKVQLEHKWLGVLTLQFKNSADSSEQHWILRAAETSYNGFYEYEIPTEYTDGTPIVSRYFTSQHRLAEESNVPGETIMPWVLEIMMNNLTIGQAESIAIARHKLYQDLRSPDESDTAKRQETQKEIAKVLRLLVLK